MLVEGRRVITVIIAHRAPHFVFAFSPSSTRRRMASDTFGIGFCLARHFSTSAIISSVNEIIFFIGCVSGRPAI